MGISLWMAQTADQELRLPALDRDVEADVCVVGAGFAGLTAARELVNAGKSVVVLEARGVVGGRVARIGRAGGVALKKPKGKLIPMNIDGITAVIFCELGFEPELGRGLFILSRSVGILAHAWEQKQRGRRIMGPMPREIPFQYSGPARRDLPAEFAARGPRTKG
jgi:glycine/D-amino acid oxidase-like deaminating enzyme